MPAARQGSQQLWIYAPRTQRPGEAEVIEVDAGDVRTQVDIELDLGGLHRVTGRVAAADHHGLVDAAVALTQGGGKDFARRASSDIDGSFRLDYIPPGTYTLTLTELRDTAPTERNEPEKVVQRYHDLERTLVVTDGDTDLGELPALPLKPTDAASGHAPGTNR